MQQTILALAALAAQAYAQSYTPPTTASFGALLTPDTSNPVTQGETFTVTWDATGHEKSTVSLVLCRGGSNNCVNDKDAIVSKIPASTESYEWAVPCSLPVGTQSTSTGYGMLIIEDGTGIFQYSTQFSVLANPKCGGSSASSTAAPSSGSEVTTSALTGRSTYAVHNGTHTDSATTTAPASMPTVATQPTVIPTAASVGSSAASGSVTWSTATQPTASRPATQTALSGAGKNAAGVLFLVAMGATFLL